MKISASVVLLALLAAGASGLAWWEYQQVRDFRTGALTAGDRADLQKAAWNAQREVKRLQAQLAAARALHGVSEDAKAGAGSHAALGDFAADFLARLDDPEIRRLMDLQRMAAINRQYGEFFRDAKLTPDQVQQFEHLMLERQRAETDVIAAAADQGVNPMQDPEGFRQMVKNAQAEVDQQLQTDLGPNDWSQYQTYQRTQSQRATVTQLSSDLAFTAAPLADGQKQQLQQAIADTNDSGGGAVNDKTIAAAQAFLSPPQLQALQNLQQLQQANAQLGRLMGGR